MIRDATISYGDPDSDPGAPGSWIEVKPQSFRLSGFLDASSRQRLDEPYDPLNVKLMLLESDAEKPDDLEGNRVVEGLWEYEQGADETTLELIYYRIMTLALMWLCDEANRQYSVEDIFALYPPTLFTED